MLYGIGSLVAISMLGSTLACLSRFLCGRLCCRTGIKEGAEWYNASDFVPPDARQASQQAATTAAAASDASPRVFKYVTVVTGDVVATTVDNANNTTITPGNNIFLPNTSLLNNSNNGQTYLYQQQQQPQDTGAFTYGTVYPDVPQPFANNNNTCNSNNEKNTDNKTQGIIPSAPTNWDLPQQQQLVATRLLLVKPAEGSDSSSVSNVYPYLPSYSDAVNNK